MRRCLRTLALLLAALPGPLIAATPAPAPRPPQAIYATTCGYCHGHNVGPIILGRALPPELVTFMVRHGKGAMPAFRPTEITPAELTALASWIAAAPAAPKEHGQ
ncbi:MAG: cytochrome c [Sphingomonas fennica]